MSLIHGLSIKHVLIVLSKGRHSKRAIIRIGRRRIRKRIRTLKKLKKIKLNHHQMSKILKKTSVLIKKS
jgi:hypothetical protein